MNTQAIFPNWAELVFQTRMDLGENQYEFAKRFKVNQAQVSRWEKGISDPPGGVTWFVMARTTKPKAGL